MPVAYVRTSNGNVSSGASVAAFAHVFSSIIGFCIDDAENAAILTTLDLKLARFVLKHKQMHGVINYYVICLWTSFFSSLFYLTLYGLCVEHWGHLTQWQKLQSMLFHYSYAVAEQSFPQQANNPTSRPSNKSLYSGVPLLQHRKKYVRAVT